MTCDHDYDHWQIVVEHNGFTMANHLPKEKPTSFRTLKTAVMVIVKKFCVQ